MDKLLNIEKLFSNQDVHLYKAYINEDCEILVGHFPGNPIVPGVCSIEMIKYCLADLFQKEIVFVEIKECKFTGMIVPSNHREVHIFLKLKEKEGVTNLSAEVYSEDTKFVKLKATIK